MYFTQHALREVVSTLNPYPHPTHHHQIFNAFDYATDQSALDSIFSYLSFLE
jgi:hypothetical protein